MDELTRAGEHAVLHREMHFKVVKFEQAHTNALSGSDA